MLSVAIDLGERSYPIHIGTGIFDDPTLLEPHIGNRRVMVITDANVGPLYLQRFQAALGEGRSGSEIIAAGEGSKSLATVERLVGAMLGAGCDRQTTVIALGGGVVGDLAGFTAACFQRGVDYIQVPTTLLAQVDSSVGGKTGVNHALGKNMIGAFHQPSCVIADTATLSTLPDRELRAGLAEVIKYGLIGDAAFLSWIEVELERLLARDPDALVTAIEHACRAKAAIVAADEREGGVRALLNLGHTFGHAIETASGYGQWLHGEAVAAGLAAAADLSRRMGLLDDADTERVRTLLKRAGLPVHMPQTLDPSQAIELMSHDKKVRDGRIRLVLLRRIGDAFISDDYPEDALHATLVACRG